MDACVHCSIYAGHLFYFMSSFSFHAMVGTIDTVVNRDRLQYTCTSLRSHDEGHILDGYHMKGLDWMVINMKGLDCENECAVHNVVLIIVD